MTCCCFSLQFARELCHKNSFFCKTSFPKKAFLFFFQGIFATLDLIGHQIEERHRNSGERDEEASIPKGSLVMDASRATEEADEQQPEVLAAAAAAVKGMQQQQQQQPDAVMQKGANGTKYEYVFFKKVN